MTWVPWATVGFLVVMAVASFVVYRKSQSRLLLFASPAFVLAAILVCAAPFLGAGDWRNQALFAASAAGDAQGVDDAMSRGADVNARDGSGLTPLMYAARGDHASQREPAATDHPEVVQRLLAHGADVNAATSTGFVALFWAARYGHEKVVKALLDKGANPNATDKDGMTALKWAAANRDSAPAEYDRVIDILKEAGEEQQ